MVLIGRELSIYQFEVFKFSVKLPKITNLWLHVGKRKFSIVIRKSPWLNGTKSSISKHSKNILFGITYIYRLYWISIQISFNIQRNRLISGTFNTTIKPNQKLKQNSKKERKKIDFKNLLDTIIRFPSEKCYQKAKKALIKST